MSAVMPVYRRSELQFQKGEGVYLYTASGEKYLDFAAGIAVNSLGHSHPEAVKALKDQADKLWHVSNMYHIEGLEAFAQTLADNSFADKIFFCNSGAEAVECGLKMIRKYHDETGNPDKFRVITFTGAFHGRTLTTISAGDRAKIMAGFEPAVEGFDNVPFLDLDAVKAAIGPETGGILIEPVQGEGGIRPVHHAFLKALRQLCDDHGLLLMFDGVQCGMGRTGKFFSHEWAGVNPDICASAKGIGNGFPLGACLATDEAAKGMQPGTHGSTYGSNPLAVKVGHTVVNTILSEGFLENVVETGQYLKAGLEKIMASHHDAIEEIRGVGLMLGMKMRIPNADMVEKLREHKLLTVPAGDNVVRLLPPLIVNKAHCDEALDKIQKAIKELS